MASSRTLIVIGSICLMVAVGNLVVGSTAAPWVTLVAIGLGSIAFIAALVMKRGDADRPKSDQADRSERYLRVFTYGLAGLGLVAFLVALIVAEGEARGHAILHLLTGLVCLGLFAALAFLWHPRAGGGAAALRGLVLMLLAVAGLGALLESLGGAGYDAANAGHRIELLTSLHNMVTPLGALLLIAVPLAIITGIVVLIARATRRDVS
jgi:hypothetical protein